MKPLLVSLSPCLLVCLFPYLTLASDSALADRKPIADFTFTERSGRQVSRADLLGKVWIASFVFTRCTSGCPQVTTTMARLQDELAAYPDIVFVTFTVDPRHDNPDELKKYAEQFHADPNRWLFLTGKEEEVYDLIQHSFFLPVEHNNAPDHKPGDEVIHSTSLALIDRQGYVRKYCEGLPAREAAEDREEYERKLDEFQRDAIALSRESLPFPEINAFLNTTCVFLLLIGYFAIRLRWIRLHKTCMLTALAVSAIFLASYLYYHIVVREGQPTHFADRAPEASTAMRNLYLAILLTHTALAIVVAPLALYTAYQGLRNHLARHVRIARWTLPIWLYVSVTGVVVYWMLYRLYPPP